MNPTKNTSKRRSNQDAIRNIKMILRSSTWNFNVMKHILTLNSSFINEPKFSGYTLLQKMIIDDRGTEETVRFLIDLGADVNLASYNGCLLLRSLTFCKDREEIVRLLIEKGAHFKDERYGESALSEAVANGYGTDILEMITRSGVDPNHINRYSQSVLCTAIARGRELEILDFLLNAGATIGACKLHQSSLHCVASSNPIRHDVVRLLLKNGAGGNVVVDDLNTTVLHAALRNSKYETAAMKMMLRAEDVDVNSTDTRGSTMLHEALCNNDCKLGVVQLLVDLGAEVDSVDQEGDMPLHKAVLLRDCHPGIVRTLLKHGSPVNVANNYDETSFEIAIRKRQSLEIVCCLLSSGERVCYPRLPSLMIALDNFKSDRTQDSLDCLQTLLKYSFLENREFDMIQLVHGDRDFCGEPDVWITFWNFCLKDIDRMSRKSVWDDLTLLEVVGYDEDDDDDEDIHRNTYDMYIDRINRHLLMIVGNGEFPCYKMVIAAKIGYEFLEQVFTEMMVSVRKLDTPGSVELTLNSQCLEHLGKFLSHDDLINMILVFHRDYRR